LVLNVFRDSLGGGLWCWLGCVSVRDLSFAHPLVKKDGIFFTNAGMVELQIW
jgi:hypothetical protein